MEVLSTVWTEDIQKLIDAKALDIDHTVTRTKEVISRLYPILYSEEFKDLNTSSVSCAIGDIGLSEKRKKLLQSALRFGAIHKVQTKVTEAPYELTVFKPFNVRELEYDVWDTSRSKHDKMVERLDKQGLFADDNQAASSAA